MGSNKFWKSEERRCAALFGGKRFPANTGGPIDFETEGVVAQVKNVRRLSLTELEKLAVEIAQLGQKKGKLGLVVVKRRAGRGSCTPRLVILTEHGIKNLRIGFQANGDGLGLDVFDLMATDDDR